MLKEPRATTVILDYDSRNRIRLISYKHEISLSEVIRRAVEQYYKNLIESTK